MTAINSEIFLRGRALAQGLRQEGRRNEAETVDALLRAVAQGEQTTQYLTTGHLAERLGVSRQTVVNWIKKGLLPGVRLGSRLMVPATALAPFAQIEHMLDQLDAEVTPPSRAEIIELVSQGRKGWTWPDKGTCE